MSHLRTRHKCVVVSHAFLRYTSPMPNAHNDKSMRVNVTLYGESVEDLVKVMAAMPSTGPGGLPVTIGPADAIRYALKVAAKSPRR